MPLRKSRKKTSDFFNKTFKSLKSMFHGGHLRQNNTRPPCSNRKTGEDVCIKEEYYSDSERWMDEFDKDGNLIDSKVTNKVSNECLKKDEERRAKENRIARDEGCLKKEGSCRISQRMKELEMMEFKDVDHVLDVEEVLHYYSRLRSPVYLDIVDSFFTDMYTELHKPPQQRNCGSLHGSSRRLGPVRLYE